MNSWYDLSSYQWFEQLSLSILAFLKKFANWCSSECSQLVHRVLRCSKRKNFAQFLKIGDRNRFDPIGGNFVDLRSYGLVTDIDDGAIAAANGKAISKAFLDRPANAMFVLPMGRTYVNRDLAGLGIHRLAALQMTALKDVVLAGWGPGATQLIMTGSQANGLSQVIQI